MLELGQADGAFDAIGEYLRGAGFFTARGDAAAGRCADVYLGHALSEPARRSGRTPRPEPAVNRIKM